MAPLEVRRGGHTEPYAELTPLGWVIAGPIPTASGPRERILRVQVSEADEDANHQLRKLWEIDIFGVRGETAPSYTHSEQRAVDVLSQTCRQEESGYELGFCGKLTDHRYPTTTRQP